MRMVRQRVLPLPAPALTSSGEPGAASTASRCAASSASSAAASAMSTAPAPLLENTAAPVRDERGTEEGKPEKKNKNNTTFKHFPRGLSALLLRCCEMKTTSVVALACVAAAEAFAPTPMAGVPKVCALASSSGDVICGWG